MAGVRLLAMQLLCFRKSGYSALWEERPMSPLGTWTPALVPLPHRDPQDRHGQGSSGEGRQAALLVHTSKGQPGVGKQLWASHSEGREQPELRADIATRTRMHDQIWTSC